MKASRLTHYSLLITLLFGSGWLVTRELSPVTAQEKFVNNAKTTLNGSISNSTTTIVVASGAAFPSPTGSEYFYATLDNGTSIEVVKCTARSSNTLTCARGQQGTSGTAFASGTRFEMRLTKQSLEDLQLTVKEVDGSPSGVTKTLRFSNGAVTNDGSGQMTVAVGTGDASTNTSSSVDSEIALFSSTGGKTLKRATGSGLATVTSGVLGTVTAPSGTVVGTSDTQTLTNKTLTTPIMGAYTVAGLPAAGTAGRLAVVTDAGGAGSCTSGGGSALSLCRDSGAAWAPVGDGGGGGGNVATDAIFDAKGDLAAGTGADAAAKLSVGTNGFTLVANSGASTGLDWAAYPTARGCRVKRASGNVTAANGGAGTAIGFDAEDFDSDSYHDNATNNTRITIPTGLGGVYLLGGAFYADVNCDINVLLNGATTLNFGRSGAGDASLVAYTLADVYSFSAGDYIELIATGRGSTKTVYFDSTNKSPHFWMVMVGK